MYAKLNVLARAALRTYRPATAFNTLGSKQTLAKSTFNVGCGPVADLVASGG